MPGNKSWRVTSKTGFEGLKQFDEDKPQLGDKDVLVKCKHLHLTTFLPRLTYPPQSKVLPSTTATW